VSSRAASLAYRGGWGLLKRVPERPARTLFDLAAAGAARRGGKGTRRLRENLARVTGLSGRELEDLTRAGMRSYARYWLEVFRLPAMDPADVVARWTWQDAHLLREAYEEGRGAIMALPHMGNWDAAGSWLVSTIAPFTTVAERLEPAELFDQFVAFRESLGMEVLAHRGGEEEPIDILTERLRAGGLICLLADRDLSDRGVPVTLCGGPTSVPAGPALLALRTGAALLPVTLWSTPTDPRGWSGRIHPRLEGDDVAGLSQQLADIFGDAIRAHPEDWHMLGRVWRD
jgi:lauroyl/myristoyl acyltransferase